jgi:hypothetical protein
MQNLVFENDDVILVNNKVILRGKTMEEFEVFYNAYPRKMAKGDARRAWVQTTNLRPSIETLLSAIKAQCATDQWMQGGGKFIPYPATWLRQERWDDIQEVSLPDVVNEKPWHETASGIEAKGKELGLDPSQFNTFPEFRAAVMQKSLKAA